MATPRRRTTSATARKKPTERVGLGGGSVDKHLARPKKRRQGRFVNVGDGNTIVVRAFDTEKYFKDGWVHPVQFERKDGSTYTMDVRCLDPDDEGEPCPGCRDDLDRRYKFWLLVIVRDAPKENKAGKVIGEEDQVRILSGANRLVKALNQKHKRRNLDRRDVEVSQDGEGFEVQYEVEWATDEDVPLSRADKKLIDEADDVIEAFDRYTSIPDEDDFYEPPGFDNDDDGDDDVGERSLRRGGVFDRERKKGSTARRRSSSNNDKEDDDGKRPVRRTAKKAAPKGIAAARKKSSNGGKATIKRKIR
jgi:hypothetical protein